MLTVAIFIVLNVNDAHVGINKMTRLFLNILVRGWGLNYWAIQNKIENIAEALWLMGEITYWRIMLVIYKWG